LEDGWTELERIVQAPLLNGKVTEYADRGVVIQNARLEVARRGNTNMLRPLTSSSALSRKCASVTVSRVTADGPDVFMPSLTNSCGGGG
jgi:hypothetical protein